MDRKDLKVGTVLEKRTSRCLWKVVAIGPWPASRNWPSGGEMATLEHASADDRARWPGFQDREGVSVVLEIAEPVLSVKTHICGCVWAEVTPDGPVEPEAVDGTGRGFVLLEYHKEER